MILSRLQKFDAQRGSDVSIKSKDKKADPAASKDGKLGRNKTTETF
jgi:hypothetical protein